MEKKISSAFGRTVYLLGENVYNQFVWLEQAVWDCHWHWEFGYVEIYTNQKNPNFTKDILSHSHFNNLIWKNNAYNKYIYHLNECPEFISTVLTDKEAWELSDLMKSFYALREVSEIYYKGNSHFTNNTEVNLKNKNAYKRICTIELPQIFTRIYNILSPSYEEYKSNLDYHLQKAKDDIGKMEF